MEKETYVQTWVLKRIMVPISGFFLPFRKCLHVTGLHFSDDSLMHNRALSLRPTQVGIFPGCCPLSQEATARCQ